MSWLKLFGHKIRAKDVAFNDGTTLDSQVKTYTIIGTIVRGVSSTSAQVHTFSDIQTLFQNKYGVKPGNVNEIGVSYTNGDGTAQAAHIDGATHQNSIFYAVFDRTVSGNIRINYCYTYVA